MAKALLRKPSDLNKTESRYWDHLFLRQRAGDIVDYRFHEITFKLGPDCRYTPEALVIRPDGSVEIHEVKGFMRDDARAKLHTAARLFPWFRFILVTETGRATGTWHLKEVVP